MTAAVTRHPRKHLGHSYGKGTRRLRPVETPAGDFDFMEEELDDLAAFDPLRAHPPCLREGAATLHDLISAQAEDLRLREASYSGYLAAVWTSSGEEIKEEIAGEEPQASAAGRGGAAGQAGGGDGNALSPLEELVGISEMDGYDLELGMLLGMAA